MNKHTKKIMMNRLSFIPEKDEDVSLYYIYYKEDVRELLDIINKLEKKEK